eukprot:TRINITY_DN39924_c0_g1_i1.p1 TRINITY_DN39924_c0_g1~~TRINITY_DN39924_c0_g1_i1.p1  ORF type:complete len:267 (-),score=83.49 TRINITY_DN39924_c0_g1_i1:94-849(-)
MAGGYEEKNPGDDLPAAQVADVQRLMEELPRIDAALKNFLSLRMAQGFMPAEEGQPAASPAVNGLALQGCARVLLKTLNAHDALSAQQWGQQHPQGPDERGLDYMARLSNYKVAQSLWARSQQAGEKPSKMLGRSALQVMLPEVTKKILADVETCAKSAGTSKEQLENFLADFAAVTAETADMDLQTAADSELVWAKDMRRTLADRQQLRQQDADARKNREASATQTVAEMRAALSSQEGSSVQIEEVIDS